ncbi:MAG TPA: hypothetical protein PL064_10505, partial [Thermogutta sp.]|nr:hypothetical protein [Thermogutta sp.]
MQTLLERLVFSFGWAKSRILCRRVCEGASVVLVIAMMIHGAVCTLALDCQAEKPRLKPRIEGD